MVAKHCGLHGSSCSQANWNLSCIRNMNCCSCFLIHCIVTVLDAANNLGPVDVMFSNYLYISHSWWEIWLQYLTAHHKGELLSCLGMNKPFSLSYLCDPCCYPFFVLHMQTYQTGSSFAFVSYSSFVIQYIFLLVAVLQNYPLGTCLVSNCTVGKFHDLWPRTKDLLSPLLR